MKRGVYILPTTLEHAGITHKFNGQCQALKKRVHLQTCYMTHSRTQSWIRRYLGYLLFECKAFFYCLFSPIIYIRYNPKTLVLSLFLPFFSIFKQIYIEHNTIMTTELQFLGRHWEYRLHRLTILWFRLGRFTHIAVNQELKRHLETLGLSRVVYAQNGYSVPDTRVHSLDTSLINNIDTFKKGHEHLAIFCGNGYPWHGYEDIMRILSAFPSIGVLVVGPYKADKKYADHCLSIPFCDTPSLGFLIEQCDFAISTFRWDMLSITEGSPLKSRQYLCHGCPVLVNYTDCASDFSELAPYIIDYRQHQDKSIALIIEAASRCETLSDQAQTCLSWDNYFSFLSTSS